MYIQKCITKEIQDVKQLINQSIKGNTCKNSNQSAVPRGWYRVIFVQRAGGFLFFDLRAISFLFYAQRAWMFTSCNMLTLFNFLVLHAHRRLFHVHGS